MVSRALQASFIPVRVHHILGMVYPRAFAHANSQTAVSDGIALPSYTYLCNYFVKSGPTYSNRIWSTHATLAQNTPSLT